MPRLENGLLPFDDVCYGNPTKKWATITNELNEYDYFISQFLTTHFPLNSTEETISELDFIERVMDKTPPKLIEEAKEIDKNLVKWLIRRLNKLELPFEEKIFDRVIEITTPIVIKLKYFYNRARPKSLAFYYDKKIYPEVSWSAETPSYPSAHTFQIKVFCDIVGNLNPPFRDDLNLLTKIVAKSRIVMGANYPSDNQFAYDIADKFKKEKRLREIFYE